LESSSRSISYIGKTNKLQLQIPTGRSAASTRVIGKNYLFSVPNVLIDSFIFEKTLESLFGIFGRLLFFEYRQQRKRS